MSSSSSKSKPSPNPKFPAPKPLPTATTMSTPKRKRMPRDQNEDEDTVTILNAVASFRSSHGGVAPTRTTMAPVFDAVKDSLHRPLTIDQLHNKFRTLKHRFQRSGSERDRAFYNLSIKAWGQRKRRKRYGDGDDNEEEVEEEENAGAADWCKYLRDQVTESWREKEMSMVALEMGLKAMDKARAKTLEEEWRECFEGEMRIGVKAMELNGEILQALVDRV